MPSSRSTEFRSNTRNPTSRMTCERFASLMSFRTHDRRRGQRSAPLPHPDRSDRIASPVFFGGSDPKGSRGGAQQADDARGRERLVDEGPAVADDRFRSAGG